MKILNKIDWKTHNATIIDETNISEIEKIDSVSWVPELPDYKKLINVEFIQGRLIYEKASFAPIIYWFLEEEIGNFNVKIYNSILTKTNEMDIIISFYRDRCIEIGNTLSVFVPEESLTVCNYLKRYPTKTSYQNPYIVFKFFVNHQQDWLDKEMNVI